MKKIVMISNDYPAGDSPAYAFVDTLARGLAGAGADVHVISPYVALKRRMSGLMCPPYRVEVMSNDRGRLTVYRPRFFSASTSVLGVNTARLSLSLFTRAVYRVIREENLAPDVLYGHFISMSGLCAAEIGEKIGIPSFLAFGESSEKQFESFKDAFLRVRLQKMNGAIAVSGENRRRLLSLHYFPEERVAVIPNAIDPEIFHPIDRRDARESLKLPMNAFIVAFVGSFIKRKGVSVLTEALKSIPDSRAVFIGQGPESPDREQVLFSGPVEHKRIRMYLSAADVFALPTENEGCCNAIIEALACGLPVVSSDLPFNDDILTHENSLRVDPADADMVAGALKALKDDLPLRERLSSGALNTAKHLTIGARAQRILSFMEEHTNEHHKKDR